MSVQVNKLLQDAISAHQQGNLKKADSLYSKILSRDRRHAEAIHMRGVLKLEQKNYDYAKLLLADAAKLEPANPLIKYHQGDLYRVTGEFTAAEKYFKQALKLGATDGDVYFMLANSQYEQALYSDALENYLKAVDSAAEDPDYRLNLANCYEQLNEPDKALEHLLFAASVNSDPSVHLHSIELLALTGNHLEVSERVSHLSTNLTDKQDFDIKVLLQTTKAVLDADRAEDASRLLDTAMTLDFSDLTQDTLALFSGLLVNIGRYKDARKVLDESVSRFKPDAIAWFQKGLCEQTGGEFESAAHCHRQALECDASFGRAAYSLAINGKSNVTDTEVGIWQQQSQVDNNGKDEQIQFLFAIARTLDGRGEIESAFLNYKNANDMHHAHDPFDPDRWDAYIDSVIENFSADFFNNTKHLRETASDDSGANLVFIVGMPRSGSTLLEYQLSRQLDATALGEHPTVRRLFMDLPLITQQNQTVPQCAKFITAEHAEYMRTQYMDSIKLYSNNSQPAGRAISERDNREKSLVVDKMLGNFLRLGILATMFPKAKILHCSRDAEPTCVSCYTNLFARGLKFTYNLNGLGRAWNSYQRLMDHWRKVLPLTIYDVTYEQVVTQPEDVFTELSEYLGSEANPQLAGSDTGAINTASFYQARQPITTKSVQGWKRFEPYLDQLQEGLGR